MVGRGAFTGGAEVGLGLDGWGLIGGFDEGEGAFTGGIVGRTAIVTSSSISCSLGGV